MLVKSSENYLFILFLIFLYLLGLWFARDIYDDIKHVKMEKKAQALKQGKPKTAVVRLPQGSVIELPDGQKLNGVEFVSEKLSK